MVYATSPNLRLRHLVAALQAEVQHLQAQVGTPAGTVSVPVPGAGVRADAALQPARLGTLPAPAAVRAEITQVPTDAADHKTYRQRYVTCGKPGCRTCTDGPGHGPYWYAYWREGTKIRSAYIGKQRPIPSTA